MHSTADEAAGAALTVALTLTRAHGFEFGGLVYRRPDGRHDFTFPLTSMHPDRFEGGIPYPVGMVLAGTYHTHPAGLGRYRGHYSPEDVEDAEASGVPSYLGLADSGDILKYLPGVSPVLPSGHSPGTRLKIPH